MRVLLLLLLLCNFSILFFTFTPLMLPTYLYSGVILQIAALVTLQQGCASASATAACHGS